MNADRSSCGAGCVVNPYAAELDFRLYLDKELLPVDGTSAYPY